MPDRGILKIEKETVLFSEPPESAVEIGVQGNKVRAAIDKLGSKHKAIIIMRFYQEMSYDDMARVLEINVGTVKSRLSEAKSQLETLLEGAI